MDLSIYFFLFDPTKKKNYIYIYIYIYISWPIGIIIEVLKFWESWVPLLVESYQRLKIWYLMPPYLTLSIIWYGSKVSVSIQGKE